MVESEDTAIEESGTESVQRDIKSLVRKSPIIIGKFQKGIFLA
ncbi:hypothetical protein [Methanosarcina horonobensis]|nr:hypothetical protein [Methanosarcina horonobensis]